jgi:hypothetical protein
MRASKAGCLSSGTSDKRIDYSPGNGNHGQTLHGDGEWPKPGMSGCSQPDAIAFSLITAGQRDADVLDTSGRACRQLASERRHITWLVT